jgi:hypothetical protein
VLARRLAGAFHGRIRHGHRAAVTIFRVSEREGLRPHVHVRPSQIQRLTASGAGSIAPSPDLQLNGMNGESAQDATYRTAYRV